MPVWTVDTWRVRSGTEAHFLSHSRALSPQPLTLYRDLEDVGLFWSPAKWESLQALNEWRAGAQYSAAIRSLEGDVVEHRTHVMEDVAGHT